MNRWRNGSQSGASTIARRNGGGAPNDGSQASSRAGPDHSFSARRQSRAALRGVKGEEEIIGIPMDGKIFNSQGVHVAFVRGPAIFDLKGKKLYELRDINIYKLSGELVGHLANAQGDKELDKATDK